MKNWLHPLTFIDEDDYRRYLARGTERSADEERWQLRRDLLVEWFSEVARRPTEVNVLCRLFEQAHKAFSGGRLTRRQEQALAAREEAYRAGKDGYVMQLHVANRLGIARSSAAELLQRADLAREFNEFAPRIRQDEAKNIVKSRQRERRIQARMAAIPHDCAGAGLDCCTTPRLIGKSICCAGCYQVYGKLAEDEQPRWWRERVALIRAELRNEAVASLAREGGV